MITQLSKLLQRSGHFWGLLSTFFGSFFQLLYLSNVEKTPFYVLLLGVALIVAGSILLFEIVKCNAKAEPFFLISVYIMYFAVSIMLFVRFPTFSGTDNLTEYRAAEVTLNHGWNTPTSIMEAKGISMALTEKLSCVGTTILPAIFSMVSGMSLITVFEFGLTTVICLKPILVYLNVKEVFGKRELAALSAILYSQLYFVFYSFNTRDSIATVFLLCALLIFFKSIEKRRRTFVPLLCIFMFSMIASHYTIAYSSNVFLFVFILTLYVASKLPKKGFNVLKIDFQKPHVDMHFVRYFFAFCIISSLAWFSFVPTSPFFWHLASMARSFVPEYSLPEYSQQTRFISGSPLGPLIENWFKLEVVLAIAGCIFLVFKVKKNSRMLLWLSAGGFFFVGFLISYVPYTWFAFGDFTRVYRMGFPFFSAFIALILLKLDKRSKGFVLVFFLLLNLPMNMLLPIHNNYVLFHPKEVVPPERAIGQVYIDEAEFEFSRWTHNHVPTDGIISVDARGFRFLYYTNNKKSIFMDILTFHSRYLVLHYFSIKYGLWESRGSIVMRSDQVPSLINSNNVIYSDGQNIMLYRNIINNP